MDLDITRCDIVESEDGVRVSIYTRCRRSGSNKWMVAVAHDRVTALCSAFGCEGDGCSAQSTPTTDDVIAEISVRRGDVRYKRRVRDRTEAIALARAAYRLAQDVRPVTPVPPSV